MLSKANDEGDQRGNSKAPTSPHCKHTIGRRRVCVLCARDFFFSFPPQSGRDVDLLNSAAGTVARNFHGAGRDLNPSDLNLRRMTEKRPRKKEDESQRSSGAGADE